ncbi:MAG TPA: DUF559 domain-containing protein, partial [Rhodanobacteraceae bacterium]|nr:DUF559 domain-containing protein [Rhodanobacteraceae bacterium]
CVETRLVVELDGGQHSEHATYDNHRSAILEKSGFRVLRFWNDEVAEECRRRARGNSSTVGDVTLTPALSRQRERGLRAQLIGCRTSPEPSPLPLAGEVGAAQLRRVRVVPPKTQSPMGAVGFTK